MTAITQRLLHLRPVLRPHPYYLRHFSSTSDSDSEPKSDLSEPNSEPESQSQPRSSFSSIFNDVKASLQREPPQQNRFQSLRKDISSSDRTSPQTPPPPKITDFEEIQRNLIKFRSPSAASPPSSSTGQFISLQELYKRNVIAKADDTAASPNFPAAKRPSYDTVRESLRQLRANSPKIQTDSRGNANDPMSLARFNETLKLKRDQSADKEPSLSFLGKEKNAAEDVDLGTTAAMRTKLVRMYNYSDLGEKLKTLRPEKKKGKWFSLHELNERLAKLRVIEEKETAMGRMRGGIFMQDLRETLASLDDDKAKKKKTMQQRLDVLGHLGGTPSFMLSPPKDELVEKYFHPDNMSSAEKLKLELQKVRDEFKMSESDCGSARVQVAQLTTKIKHLSTVLQKKDKHSRKGLQAMVQRRKKLLKYLRRTDWDSYCLVLSKLGLRDNPDIKA